MPPTIQGENSIHTANNVSTSHVVGLLRAVSDAGETAGYIASVFEPQKDPTKALDLFYENWWEQQTRRATEQIPSAND